MHWIVDNLRKKAKKNPKVIVFPESEDERVNEAVEIIKKEQIALPILLKPEDISKEKINEYAQVHYNHKPKKYSNIEEVKKLIQNPLYYAAMMTRLGDADGFVAGAVYATSSVVRAALRCLEIDPAIKLVSGCFVMAIENCAYGEKGVLVYSDCAVVPYPTPEQLSLIALSAANFTKNVLGFEPRIAFLSFSTKSSSHARWTEKIREAVKLTKNKDVSLLVEGELQADSAIDREVARRKIPDSQIAGKANILIFPDLDAGNISYKLTQRLAKARALGPIMLGLKQSCSDLSRGCLVEDIVDCAAITVIRAQ